MTRTRRLTLSLLLVGLLVAADPAYALRCSSKLILEGMLEVEVRAHCGEPTAARDLGYVVRSYHPLRDRNPLGAFLFRYGPGEYYQEVLVTEYIYNFGPRRLMRKLRFEGGVLSDIETLGRGYLER